MMDGALIPNCWTQYDLARKKLDLADYRPKKSYHLNRGFAGMDPETNMM